MKEIFLALGGAFVYSLALGALEFLSRRFSLPAESTRRIAHMLAGIIVAFVGSQISFWVFAGFVVLFVPIVLVSRKMKVFRHIHNVARPTIGEELLPIGFISAHFIASGRNEIFLPAILITGLADPIAGILVQKFNSFVGFLGFFAVAVATLAVFSSLSVINIIVMGTVIAIVERGSPRGSDNLTVPLATAWLLRFTL